MTSKEEVAEKALLSALSSGAFPLKNLLSPIYYREFRTTISGDLIRMEIDKRGFRRYKRRYPWPKYPPPPAHVAEIRDTLNRLLHGFTVQHVTDCGSFVAVYLKEDFTC